MISHYLALEGYPKKIPALADRKVEFQDGLNIIVGPNGSGKSTMLKTMAENCAIPNGGWTSTPDILAVSWDKPYPDRMHKYIIKDNKIDIGWDGTPTFYGHIMADTDSILMQPGYNRKDSLDGMTSFSDQLRLKSLHLSKGQLRMHKFHLWLEAIQNLPAQDHVPADAERAGYQTILNHRMWLEYRISLNPTGRHTILLDEPESGLAFNYQTTTWKNVIIPMAEKHQVIVATNSIAPMLMQHNIKANWIELSPGFIKSCVDACLALCVPQTTDKQTTGLENDSAPQTGMM